MFTITNPSKRLIRDARAILRAVGIELKTTDYDEFRVNFARGREATAYYTTDLNDAVQTGIVMSKRKGKK